MPYADPEKRREAARRARAARTPEQVEAERARQRARAAANSEQRRAKRMAAYAADPEFYKAKSRADDRAVRAEMIAAYGGKCACCGETEERFLCLDHVGGGGHRERALYGGRNGGIIRRLRREGWPQDGYRLLCANCNMATAWGRRCPHEEKSRA